MRELKDDLIFLAEESTRKESLYHRLNEQKESLPPGVNR